MVMASSCAYLSSNEIWIRTVVFRGRADSRMCECACWLIVHSVCLLLNLLQSRQIDYTVTVGGSRGSTLWQVFVWCTRHLCHSWRVQPIIRPMDKQTNFAKANSCVFRQNNKRNYSGQQARRTHAVMSHLECAFTPPVNFHTKLPHRTHSPSNAPPKLHSNSNCSRFLNAWRHAFCITFVDIHQMRTRQQT